jgi:hypothetical protein
MLDFVPNVPLSLSLFHAFENRCRSFDSPLTDPSHHIAHRR